MDEYADGFWGSGDVDSGPALFGVSVAATGFSLALARAHERADVFERLYRTTHLFASGHAEGTSFRSLTGGPVSLALGLVLLAHAALTWLLAHADEGLITPETNVSPGVLVLGVLTLVVRVTVMVALPLLFAYSVTQTVFRRLS